MKSEAEQLKLSTKIHNTIIERMVKDHDKFIDMVEFEHPKFNPTIAAIAQSCLWDVMQLIGLPSELVLKITGSEDGLSKMVAAEATIAAYLELYLEESTK